MEYIGVNGTRYTVVEPALGKGGEGAVYRILGVAGSVAKVFKKEKRTESRHRKLLIMLNTSMPDSATEQITWPKDVIYENGSFVGYIMPKIMDSEELNVMYSDKYICTLPERITIAKNLCAAINSVHNVGHVCGDLNPKNIKVDPNTARVVLVDTDSYHITEKNGPRVYRCEVGLPEYLPREIQEKMRDGNRLETAPLPTFTRYTDLFALAVHIFALLMNGCHPFACAVDNGAMNIAQLTSSQPSVSAPQPIDNICTGFFPFQMKRNSITTPRYAPDYEYLPVKIRALFSKAFINGHNAPYERPDCIEWYQALEEMQTSLRYCDSNPTHMYPKNLSKCPWCEMENRFKSVPYQLKQTSINTNQRYVASQTRSSSRTPITTPNVNARNTTTQQTVSMSWFGWGKWIAIVICVLVFISVIKSCGSNHNASSGSSYNAGYSSQSGSSYGDSSDARTDGNDYDNQEETIETDLEFSTIIVPSLPVNTIDVPSITKASSSIDNAEIQQYSGSISYDDQKDEYWFTPKNSGRYRFDISGLQSGTSVRLYVKDDGGTTLGSDTYCCNGEGVTIKDLPAGKKYQILVQQDYGFSDYSLEIGMQKPTVDITGYTEISDTIEYKDQRNVYTFVAPIDGRYRFEISGLQNGTDVALYMFNNLGETLTSDTYCCNGEGITVKDLKAGAEYEIQVRQDSGFSSYSMAVGYQKETVDISDLSQLSDSVEYKDQRNVYTFTVPVDGRYRFEISELRSGTDVSLYMFNSLGETVASDTYCCNDEGITVKDLKAGETYEIQVRQDSGLSGYKLFIGYQKIPVDIDVFSNVFDSMEYTDQRNVYILSPDFSGKIRVGMSELQNGVSVTLYAFNYLDESIDSDTYCVNGDYISFEVTAGNTYEIQVRQDSGLSSYNLTIDTVE